MGLSQKQLAEKLNISFQQPQKYEVGANRLIVSRLVEIASILKVSISILIGDISEISCGYRNAIVYASLSRAFCGGTTVSEAIFRGSLT